MACNRVVVEDLTSRAMAPHYFAVEIEVKDIEIEQILQEMYSADSTEQSLSALKESNCEMSFEDIRFVELMNRECAREVKHYKLSLPLRDQDQDFSSNRKMAGLRLHNLKKRFKHDKKFHEVYTNFMQDMISKGHAELQDEKKCQQGKVWYIPHHAVFHPSKPVKLRVVFDFSAEWHGISLNKSFMSSPDLTNQIIGVLVKFGKEPVAVMADIEAMFYQVFVAEKHRSLLSFLWWENGNCNLLPKTYHMNVHVYGGASLPSCSNYALQKTAVDNETEVAETPAPTLQLQVYIRKMHISKLNKF